MGLNFFSVSIVFKYAGFDEGKSSKVAFATTSVGRLATVFYLF